MTVEATGQVRVHGQAQVQVQDGLEVEVEEAV